MTATVTQLPCDADSYVGASRPVERTQSLRVVEPTWGAVQTQLWFDAETEFTAIWSPDGTHVVVKAHTERGDVALYMTTTAQGNLADALQDAYRKSL